MLVVGNTKTIDPRSFCSRFSKKTEYCRNNHGCFVEYLPLYLKKPGAVPSHPTQRWTGILHITKSGCPHAIDTDNNAVPPARGVEGANVSPSATLLLRVPSDALVRVVKTEGACPW